MSYIASPFKRGSITDQTFELKAGTDTRRPNPNEKKTQADAGDSIVTQGNALVWRQEFSQELCFWNGILSLSCCVSAYCDCFVEGCLKIAPPTLGKKRYFSRDRCKNPSLCTALLGTAPVFRHFFLEFGIVRHFSNLQIYYFSVATLISFLLRHFLPLSSGNQCSGTYSENCESYGTDEKEVEFLHFAKK